MTQERIAARTYRVWSRATLDSLAALAGVEAVVAGGGRLYIVTLAAHTDAAAVWDALMAVEQAVDETRAQNASEP